MGETDWWTTYEDVRDPGEQEDLRQEIALGLWTALPRFRSDASERTWLHRVANNINYTPMIEHVRHT